MKQLLPIDFVSPGSAGLNLQNKGGILPAQWATKALNCILDDSRRLACRPGYSITTTTAISPAVDVDVIFEYVDGAGNTEVLLTYDGGMSGSIADPEGDDISGTVTDANGRWWLQNFNGKVIGFQDGQKPIVYSGTSFATITESSGTAPTSQNGIGLCAYGRVWGLDSDGQTIKYSGLLDETDWGTASAGSIDMSKVWTQGMDEVTAITALNSSLIVFGKNHIVVWDDDTGSVIGFDPVNAIVADVIAGTGCISQWTVQSVGNSDLLFVSRNGLQSLGRVILQKSNPLEDVSKYVRDDLNLNISRAGAGNIFSAYSPEEGWYLLVTPDVNDPKTWCFDVKNAFQDQEGATIFPSTNWDLVPKSLCVKQNGTILFGNAAGQVCTFGSDTDNGLPIDYRYHTPWLDLGEDIGNRLKLLKRIGSIILTRASATVFYKWSVDFNEEDVGTVRYDLENTASAEWNLAEWGVDEWSGALALQIVKVNARASAQYYKIKVESLAQSEFAVQQLELFAKIGRVA
jgi:hypothetical protein